MDDNALRAVLVTRLNAAVAAGGYNYAVVTKDQPTQQGISYDGQVFYEPLFEVKRGWAGSENIYNADAGNFTDRATQCVEAHFQISCQIIQDPSDITKPTPRDVLNYVCMFMQHRSTIAWFNDQYGIGLQFVSDVKTPYIQDDRDRAEMYPWFELVLNHEKSIDITTPATSSVVENVITSL